MPTRSRWPTPTRTAHQRGYDAKHQRTRAALAPTVAAGQAMCVRCHQWIKPGQAWHLDHDDHDRTKYKGPAHALCNIRAGARKGSLIAHARRSRRVTTARHSRAW